MGLESFIMARRTIKRNNIKGIKLPKVYDNFPNLDLYFTVGYWWKARPIHDYFMAEIGQLDDCREYDIDVDTLRDLLAKCKNKMETPFSYDLNNQTIEILENILDIPNLNEYSFTYLGSW